MHNIPIALWIVIGLCFTGIFIILPIVVVVKQSQVKKKAETHHVGLIIHRTGTSYHFIEMPRDRNVCTDTTKTPANPDGKPLTYYVKEQFAPTGFWPPLRNKFWQAQYQLTAWVEGNKKPVDLLREFREGGKAELLDSNVVTANLRKEKITDSVVQYGDTITALQEELIRARKGNSPIWTLIIGAIILVAIVVTFYMLKNGNSAILDQLKILNNGLGFNTTAPLP